MEHSSIALHSASCTSCMLCVRECPAWCIDVVAHTEADPTAPAYSNARRDSTTKVLESFTIDFGSCMWCGICIDVCPFDALFWSDYPLPAGADRTHVVATISDLEESLVAAKRFDGSAAPLASDPPSGRRKK